MRATVPSATQFTVKTSCFPHSCVVFGVFLASAVCCVVRVNRCGFSLWTRRASRGPVPTLLLNNRLSPPPHPRVTSSNTAAATTTTAAAPDRTSRSAEQGGGNVWVNKHQMLRWVFSGGIFYPGYLAGMTLARLCIEV